MALLFSKADCQFLHTTDLGLQLLNLLLCPDSHDKSQVVLQVLPRLYHVVFAEVRPGKEGSEQFGKNC